MKDLVTEVELVGHLQPDLWMDKWSNLVGPNNSKYRNKNWNEEMFKYEDIFYLLKIPEYETNAKTINKTDDLLLTQYKHDIKQQVLLNKLQNLRNFYDLKWKPQRQHTISCLADLSEHLQNLDKTFQTGMIGYSVAGILGDIMSIIGLIGAPFTVGISLGLTAGGVVIGVISRSANIVHVLINNALAKSKYLETLMVLEKDLMVSRKLSNMLEESASGLFHFGKNNDHSIQSVLSFPTLCKAILVIRSITAMSEVEQEKKTIHFQRIVDAVTSSFEGETTPTQSTALSYILGLVPGIGIPYNLYTFLKSSRYLYLNESGSGVIEVQEEMVKLADEIYDVSEIIDQLENCFDYNVCDEKALYGDL